MRHFMIISLLILCACAPQREPGPWGYRGHEEAINAVETDCYLHIEQINKELVAAGNASVGSVIDRKMASQVTGHSGDFPKPKHKLKQLRKIIKHYRKEVPKSDKVLRDTYKQLSLAVSGLSDLYSLTSAPQEFNAVAGATQGALNTVWGNKKALRKRETGFEPLPSEEKVEKH